ncbi:lysophospholipase L1-like esterase [Chryseobacterium ginsenosidimutans]|uniref:SGNH/GDSL hydrolase family protein n=1 Tax=Chryseobacterium ginsenosidimutans TaxID=687846 RepID=UPI002169CF13|nr:GDSL-type esterase/lipase family protein [Chryseobacterium ginsenosidimutans]MCS3867718.1 lysophospholipase L1-like esterase [Chryseobacterium ginsenosidimutans]
MSNIGKIIRVNALPPVGEREINVIYQVAAPGAATYTDYAIDANGDLKTHAITNQENIATIDIPASGLTGNVDTKLQVNEKISQAQLTALKGEATPSSFPTPYNPSDHANGLYEKWDVITEGVYTNFKDSNNNSILISSDDIKYNFIQIWVKNGVSQKVSYEKVGGNAKQVFNPNDNTNSSTMKATATRYDPSLTVLQSFLSDSIKMDISSSFINGYLRRDNSTLSNTENKIQQNIDVKEYNKLQYKCYPAVITESLANEYCSILGIKTDGTKIVIRESALVPNTPPYSQTSVDEIFDISEYDSLSISIGNLTTSLNQTPIIQLIKDNHSMYQPDAVIKYINTEVAEVIQLIDKPKGPIILNQITNFSSNNISVSNASIGSGILMLSGANSYGIVKESTLNEDSEITVIYKENLASNIIFGFNSTNSFSNLVNYKHHVFLRYNTTGVNKGKLEIIAKYNLSYSQLSTDINTNYSIGDYLKLGIRRKGLKYIFFVQNLTKGWTLKTEQFTTPTSIPFTAHNTASPAITSYSGNVSIFEYKHVCFAKDIEIAVEGDSLTFGQAASTEAQRWATMLNGNNLVMGGGADTSGDILLRLPEILKINPRYVLLDIGGNDLLSGISLNILKQNLKTIRNTLVSEDIEVIHCFPTPRTGATQIIDFLKTEPQFSRDLKIDVNTPLMDGNPNILALIYDSGDQLHLNNAGHLKKAEIINAVI